MSIPTQVSAPAGGLRSRIAAKARRRVVVTITLTDPAEDLGRVLALRQLAGLAEGASPLLEQDLAQRAAVATDLAAAEEALAAHYAEVHLVAMPPADFEAVVAAHPGPDTGPAAGADGGMDWRTALPVLLAGCAEDEDLRDEVFWAEQLAQEVWSHGELLGLWQAVFTLNARPSSTRRPKG